MLKKVSLAIIKNHEKFVFQLRDFKRWINDPGCWGLFGGHLHENEEATVGLERELVEELGWRPRQIEYRDKFFMNNYHINIFLCECDCFEKLVIREGQEIGRFGLSSIKSGTLLSRKWSKLFPIAPISLNAFRRLGMF